MKGSNIVIMSNNVGKRLAASIAERLFQKTHSVKVVRFNDGEIRIEIISQTSFKIYNSGSDTESILHYRVVPR